MRKQPRDSKGRFVKHPAQKPLPSKPPARKPPVKKPLLRKPPAHKPSVKKPLPRTLPARKPSVKKPLPRTLPARKPSVKKPLPRKPLVRKPSVKKPLPRTLPARKPPVKKPLPRKPPARKPSVKKPLSHKPSARKPLSRKPLPRKPPARKPPVKKPFPRKPPARKPPARKPTGKKPRHQYPTFMAKAAAAEMLSLTKLSKMEDVLAITEPQLDMGLKSFINADGTIDSELRLRNLPDDWRTVEGIPGLMGALSEAIRAMGAFPRYPDMGGAFWVSFALRFGPKDEAEIEEMAKFYKRFRGLLQVGAYHTMASAVPAILNNAAAIRNLVGSIWEKRSLPPAQIMARIVWTPDGRRPGRFKGEGGSVKSK